MRRLAYALAGLAALSLLCWWAIGPDWRRLLANPPADNQVLFWSLAQRDAGFRMLYRMPLVIEARVIEASASPRPLKLGPPLPLDLDPDLDAYFKQSRHASAVVLHKGAVRLERYGLGFSQRGRWTSFSVAKSLTSTLVGAAIKDGAIGGLEDPVSKYVKGLEGSAYDDVTVEQLLTMTSGVAWNEDYDDPASDVAQFGKHVAKDGLPNLISYMRRLPRAHPPGEVWNYSTGETNLVGYLVSEATKRPLAEYLSEKIWAPYGMQQDASWLLNADGAEISGCCVQAATRDFARFGQFILEGGVIDGASILPEGWLDLRRKGRGYGYQWWTYADGAFAARGIFGQGIFIDPKRDLVVALNSNWKTALGIKDGERMGRERFYRAVVEAIDKESAQNAER